MTYVQDPIYYPGYETVIEMMKDTASAWAASGKPLGYYSTESAISSYDGDLLIPRHHPVMYCGLRGNCRISMEVFRPYKLGGLIPVSLERDLFEAYGAKNGFQYTQKKTLGSRYELIFDIPSQDVFDRSDFAERIRRARREMERLWPLAQKISKSPMMDAVRKHIHCQKMLWVCEVPERIDYNGVFFKCKLRDDGFVEEAEHAVFNRWGFRSMENEDELLAFAMAYEGAGKGPRIPLHLPFSEVNSQELLWDLKILRDRDKPYLTTYPHGGYPEVPRSPAPPEPKELDWF